jgi:leader peptidase (prepilin peptidase) / N-methyltransferase
VKTGFFCVYLFLRMIEVAFFLFIFGLAIGSFLNVIIYRAIHGDSPLRGRSYCDNCKKPIAWYDNIPLISFIILRRRCRYCKTPIPWEYPAVELLTATLFVWWYAVGFTFFQLSSQPLNIIQPIFWLSVGILFLIITFTDLSYMIIPDSSVILLTAISLLYRIYLLSTGVMQTQDFMRSLIMAVAASLFFLALVALTRGKGMGLGDVKVVFPLGFIVGFPSFLVSLLVACITGALVGVILLALQKKKLKGIIPFGPFLIFGSVVGLVWGDQIVRWYLRFL